MRVLSGELLFQYSTCPAHKPPNSALLLSSSLQNKAERHANRGTNASGDVDALTLVRNSCNIPGNIAESPPSRGKKITERNEFVGEAPSAENQIADDQTDDTKDCSENDEIPHARSPFENVLSPTISRREGDEYTGAMKAAGAVLLHGYGVRGYIWGPMQAALDDRLGPIATPDLEATSITDLLNKAKARVRRHSLECDAPVAVVGHSLGAVLAAIAARDLGPEIVSAAIMLAPPFGDREHVPGALLQFLLRRHLIPPILLRPRFFSSLTPRPVKRAVFRAAVPESPGIQSLTVEPRWFHSSFFPNPLQQPSLVIASPADRLVPICQSEEFARVIGAKTHFFGAAEGVAHDDLFASPEITSSIAELLIDFIASA